MSAKKMTDYTELLNVSEEKPVNRNISNDSKYTEEMVETSHGQVFLLLNTLYLFHL